jgi:TPR repeat protein
MPTEFTGTESARDASERDETGKTLLTARDDPKNAFKKKSAMPPPLDEVLGEVAPETSNSGGGIGRLERRVGVLEAAFADVVERHENSLRDRLASLSAVEETVLALCGRMEKSEKHNAGAAKELRAAVAEAHMRLNGLEAAVVPNGGLLHSPLPPLSAPSPAMDHMEDDLSLPPMVEPSEEESEAEASSTTESYLAVARRAANASVMYRDEKPAAEAKAPRKSRAKLLLAGCLAPMVIVAATVAVLNRHPVTAKVVPAPRPSVAQASVAQKLLPPAQVVVSEPADPAPDQIASAAPITELQAKAGAGDAAAERDLGLKYLAGDGVESNEAEAARWLIGAAYKGEPTAEYWLGTLYARGRGVPVDAFQADHWYEAAAIQGNVRAMHNLAVANFRGLGRDKNDTEAAKWFEKAAELGLSDSQYNLAVFYERGTGVEKNLGEAYKWYAIAAAKGDKEALARVAALAQQLKPEELAQARSAATTFKPFPLDASANAGGIPAPSGG